MNNPVLFFLFGTSSWYLPGCTPLSSVFLLFLQRHLIWFMTVSYFCLNVYLRSCVSMQIGIMNQIIFLFSNLSGLKRYNTISIRTHIYIFREVPALSLINRLISRNNKITITPPFTRLQIIPFKLLS